VTPGNDPAFSRDLSHILTPVLAGFATSILSDVYGDRLLGTVGLNSLNTGPVQVVGRALTVKVAAGDNLFIHKALDLTSPNDILVIDGGGDTSRALVGELMATRARAQGALAFVVDGAIRDLDFFINNEFLCWAKGVCLRGPYKNGPGQINVPVVVGGMLVNPGDLICGDRDGLIAIPPHLAEQVAQAANEKKQLEEAKRIQYKNRATGSA
jgi:regulator of RNase E activity RraA